MTRQEKIIDTMDRLAADTVELTELRKKTKLQACADVYNDAIDHNNDEVARLEKELRKLKGGV